MESSVNTLCSAVVRQNYITTLIQNCLLLARLFAETRYGGQQRANTSGGESRDSSITYKDSLLKTMLLCFTTLCYFETNTSFKIKAQTYFE